MAVARFEDLMAHMGHNLEAVTYGRGQCAVIECLTCNEILVSYDAPLEIQVDEYGAALCPNCKRELYCTITFDDYNVPVGHDGVMWQYEHPDLDSYIKQFLCLECGWKMDKWDIPVPATHTDYAKDHIEETER